MFGMTCLFAGVIVLSAFKYFQIPILFGAIVVMLVLVYFVFYGLRRSSKQQLVDDVLYYASVPLVTFTLTLSLAMLTAFLVPNEAVKRLVIAGFAVFACWLIAFPDFVKQELGKQLHPILDPGPAWSDIIYTSAGILLFIGALIMQYFLVDLFR
jgi:hypothetical protein